MNKPHESWREPFFSRRDGRAGGGPLPGLHRPFVSRHWHRRGYLPHFDFAGRVQAVTFRLGDAMPQGLIGRWRKELALAENRAPLDAADAAKEAAKYAELRRRIAVYEDAGHGRCWMRQPGLAHIVEESLLHFDGERHRSLAWCVMPNHVHVLFETVPGHTVGDLVKGWKTFTARQINAAVGRTGSLWMPDYHDRFIRDAAHLRFAVAYIEENPVKAGLCVAAGEWAFSSAGRRSGDSQ